MKLILLIIFTIQSVSAHSAAPARALLRPELIVYNPQGNTPGRFVVSYKDYEDVRIDSDLDGKIDYWRVRKGHLHVETYFKNGEIYRYYVRKVEAGKVREFNYRNIAGKMVLQQLRDRDAFGRNFTTAELCESENLKIKNKILEITSISTRIKVGDVVDKLIDDSCKTQFSRKDLANIKQNLKLFLEDEDATFEKCMSSLEFQKQFQVSDSNAKLLLKVSVLNIQLQVAQIWANPDQYAGIVKCEMTNLEGAASAKTLEDGTIVVNKASNKDVSLNKTIFSHEFLHRSGIFSEEVATTISDYCSKPSKGEAITSVSEGKVSSVVLAASGNASAASEVVSSETSAAKSKVASAVPTQKRSIANVEPANSVEKTVAASSTANIPQNMAAASTSVPTSETLSLSISSPPPKTEVGSQQALTTSVAESRGVLSTANNMIGAMNTPASATTLAKTERSKIQADIDTVEFKSNSRSERVAGSAVRGVSADRLANGDRVVEEITLDGSSSAAMPAARSVTASTGSNTMTAEQAAARTTAAGTGEVRGTASARAASPGASGGLSGLGGSGGGGSIPPARGIASIGDASVTPLGADGGSGAPSALNQRTQQGVNRGPSSETQAPANAANSRDTVITMFSSRGSYAATKSKLKDQNFNKQLRTQNITIMDLYGNSYGAAKGEVIFLDEGNRFVRQR